MSEKHAVASHATYREFEITEIEGWYSIKVEGEPFEFPALSGVKKFIDVLADFKDEQKLRKLTVFQGE